MFPQNKSIQSGLLGGLQRYWDWACDVMHARLRDSVFSWFVVLRGREVVDGEGDAKVKSRL